MERCSSTRWSDGHGHVPRNSGRRWPESLFEGGARSTLGQGRELCPHSFDVGPKEAVVCSGGVGGPVAGGGWSSEERGVEMKTLEVVAAAGMVGVAQAKSKKKEMLCFSDRKCLIGSSWRRRGIERRAFGGCSRMRRGVPLLIWEEGGAAGREYGGDARRRRRRCSAVLGGRRRDWKGRGAAWVDGEHGAGLRLAGGGPTSSVELDLQSLGASSFFGQQLRRPAELEGGVHWNEFRSERRRGLRVRLHNVQ